MKEIHAECIRNVGKRGKAKKVNNEQLNVGIVD